MRNLVITFLLPVVLVIGNPLGPVNDWSTEHESFTLVPSLPISAAPTIKIKKNLLNHVNQVTMAPSMKTTPLVLEPSLSEMMEIIEASLDELEASRNRKQKSKISPENKLKNSTRKNLMQISTTTSPESDEDTTSAESDETSTESSTTTTQSTSESMNSESVENDAEVENKNHQTIPQTKVVEKNIQPLKTYADHFHNYTLMKLYIPEPEDSSSEETSTAYESQTTTEQTENGDSEETTTDGEISKFPEPVVHAEDQNSAGHQDISGNDEQQTPELHRVPLTKNSDMMDKVIFDNAESDVLPGVNDINNGNTQTQHPNWQTHHLYLRPVVNQQQQQDSYLKSTAPITMLLPPKPYSRRTNDWNMYPEIPERQTSSESMVSPNENMVTDPQNLLDPQPQYVPQFMNTRPSYFNQYQPTRTMQMQNMQMPMMTPYYPRPYFNNYQRASQPQQMLPQQMYPGNSGLGFYGDYYRSPFWTRPSSVYNRPSYWDSNSYNYNYNNNPPMYNGMATSQIYY